MNRTARRFAAVLIAGSLVIPAAGCGAREEDEKAKAGAGVTDKPCPEAVDKDKGCIYLGVISDFTGVFKGVGVPFTEGQKAFWKQVNEDGGIGDYEVDVTTYVKDSEYKPDVHARAFGEIKDKVLAIGQSLGTAQTNAILGDAEKDDILIAPASLGSNWIFEENVLEIGTNYCAEAMNVVDYAVDELGAKKVAAVHFPGDYGDDAAVGARKAAEERGIEFADIPTGPGAADEQAAAIGELLKAKPDVVLLSTGPIEMATIVGGAAAKGFKGQFIGSIPTWNAAVLDTPAAPAIKAMYLQASSIGAWDADTDGHEKMREAAGSATPNDWYAIGWAGAYGMKAVLEKAIDNDDLTREGLADAAEDLDSVDSEGMLPEGSGNWGGEPNDAAVRSTFLNAVDDSKATGVVEKVAAFTGPTAEGYDFKVPCYTEK